MVCFLMDMQAQGLGSAPFSQFSVGELEQDGFARNMGMAGVGIAMPHASYINPFNPATMAFNNRLTTYEFGVAGQYSEAQTLTKTQRSSAGNLRYIAMLFPLTKKFTIQIGLKPYSTVNLSYDASIPITNDPKNQSSIRTINYQGGLNQVYFGFGLPVYKNIKFGMTAAYVFGSINRERINTLPMFSYPNSSQFITQESYGLLEFKPSVHYRKKMPKNKFFNVGLVTTLSSNLNSQVLTTKSPGVYANNKFSSYLSDTLNESDKSLVLPNQWSLGFALEKKDNWNVGLDIQTYNWFAYNSKTKENLQNNFKIALGGEWIPDNLSFSYYKRMHYRAGFYYGELPVLVNNQKVSDVGFSLGTGLPFRGSAANINLGLMFGQRGSISNNALQEQYVRFFLGLTINDRWFIKSRVD